MNLIVYSSIHNKIVRRKFSGVGGEGKFFENNIVYIIIISLIKWLQILGNFSVFDLFGLIFELFAE